MARTFKYKINTFQKILNNQVKYSKIFKKMKCCVIGKNIIIEKELRNKKYERYPNTQTIPVSDIDKNIILERSKLHNMRAGIPELDTAIKEIEFIDKLKDIVK